MENTGGYSEPIYRTGGGLEMKRRAFLLLIAAMCVSFGACSGEADLSAPVAPAAEPVETQDIRQASQEALTAESEEDPDMLEDDSWKLEELDSDTADRLKDAFITSWNSGNWSMSELAAVGDEQLKDVVIFKSTKEEPAEYYCLVYASIHLRQRYKNDGSVYYKLSDNPNDSLVDVYMFNRISSDQSFFFFDLYGFYTEYSEILQEMKPYCGEALISVLNRAQRAELLEETKRNVGGQIYREMQALLKAGNFWDAQDLYYKTADLTYAQSRECLLLLTEYELLLAEISPIKRIVTEGGSGTFSLDSYMLNAWQDEEFSTDENDVIIYVEYHCKTSHPIMGTQTYMDYLTIPVTLDIENKSFTKRN